MTKQPLDFMGLGLNRKSKEKEKKRKRKYKIRTHRCKQIPESTSNKRVIVVKLHSFRKEKSQSHRDKIDDLAMT